jgi:hypothetical protein
MESEDVDFDDWDEPEGESEPAAEPKQEPAESEDDESEETESPEVEEEDFEDEEPEDEEPEDDAEDDEESEEDDGEGLIEVTLPGGEKAQVPLDELKAGYSRTADYTRKRQRDAAEHASAMESLRGVREQYDAKLEKLNEVLESTGPQKPDADLRRKNPGEYAAQRAEYEEFQQQLQAVGTERGTIDEARQQELLEMRSGIVEQERATLFEKVPEWGASAETAAKELGELAQFAISEYGFSQEQLDSVVDHRLLLMLRENKLARDRTSTAKKTLEGKKKKARRLGPGSRNTPPRRGKKRTQNMARESGPRTLRDHARQLESELGDDLL